MGMMRWGMGLGMVFGALVLLALLVVLVLGAVWLAREIAGRGRGPSSPSLTTAREVLLRRYAAGEVDDDELARRMAQLNNQ